MDLLEDLVDELRVRQWTQGTKTKRGPRSRREGKYSGVTGVVSAGVAGGGSDVSHVS